MRSIIVLVAVLILFAASNADARWGSHHRHSKGAHQQYPTCHYQSDKGAYDLRLFMRELNGFDFQPNIELDSKWLINPCSGAHDELCPPGTAVCEVTPKNTAISYGNVSDVQWAEVEGGVELTFANGEKCNNGVARKAVVQFICTPTVAGYAVESSRVTDIRIDDCMVSFTIASFYGCAAEQVCSVFSKDQCKDSDGLCEYDHHKNTCRMDADNCRSFGRLHLSHNILIGVCVGVLSVLLCGCTCCVLGCRRRRLVVRRRVCKSASRRASTSASRAKKDRKLKAKKPAVQTYTPLPTSDPSINGGDVEECVVPVDEQQQAVYIPLQSTQQQQFQPLQQPQQLMQFVYNPQQGYYPVPFAVPQQAGRDPLMVLSTVTPQI